MEYTSGQPLFQHPPIKALLNTADDQNDDEDKIINNNDDSNITNSNDDNTINSNDDNNSKDDNS